MLNFGIVGMNEGNGHPYSFAASFNGFDPEALEKYCGFPIIRKYLTTHHRNQEFIPEARISHIWTQDRAVSEGVAAVMGDNGKIGFINHDNQLILGYEIPYEPEFDYVFKDGYCVVTHWDTGGKFLFIFLKSHSNLFG